MRRPAATLTRSSKKAEITKSRQTVAGKPDLTTSAAAAGCCSAATSKTTYLIYLRPVKTSVSVGEEDIPSQQFGTNLLWIMIIYLTH